MKKLFNYLIAGCVLAILYVLFGHSYVKFYFGGKAEFLNLASSINNLCNTNKSCPKVPEGWQTPVGRPGNIREGNIFYYPEIREGGEESAVNEIFHEFTLVYGFFAPDHWFEAKGGVGRKLTSGWKNRDTPL